MLFPTSFELSMLLKTNREAESTELLGIRMAKILYATFIAQVNAVSHLNALSKLHNLMMSPDKNYCK